MKTLLTVIFMLLAIQLLSACSNNNPATTPVADSNQADTSDGTPATPDSEGPAVSSEPIRAEAMVDSIQVLVLESFPVQVNVLARGELPDGCTVIDDITTEQTGNNFEVTITTIRPSEAICTQALVSFAETIPLEVAGLEAGTYTVTVNGISGSFSLAVDNVSTDEAALTPEPTATVAVDASTATISGRLWHDLCAIGAGEGEGEAIPSDGCVAATTEEGNIFQGNGELEEDEPGIEGIVVSLGEGECPAEGLETTTTDADGEFSFTGLEAGSYCISIDALAAPNSDLLLPGAWTFPEDNTGFTTVLLESGEEAADINFGWDYQFLPLAEYDPATCIDSIEFLEDLSIPDNTIFPPGAEFTKSWRLRNNGTCPWTTDYSLASVGGDDIPGPASVPLTKVVAPGQTVDLSVTLNAPEAPGTYRENWQLSDAGGQLFGINGFIEDAFWVQIMVEEGIEETIAPGTSTIGGVVWEDFCQLLSSGPSRGCVETAEGSGIYVADGTFNSGDTPFSGVTVSLARGACPESGVIAPDALLSTTVTDEQGLYRFSDLAAGTYCVAIDALSPENVDLLIPGDWTYPARGTGRIGVLLAGGEERTNVDFGWDHEDR